MISRCSVCLREEEQRPDGLHVLQVGGSRRPAVHPTLAAWDILRVARLQGLAVPKACECGLPMTAPAGPSMPWTLSVPGGPILVGPTLEGPNGPLTIGEVTDQLEAHFPRRDPYDVPQTAFSLVLVTSMIAPVLLWMAAAATVGVMVLALARPAGFR